MTRGVGEPRAQDLQHEDFARAQVDHHRIKARNLRDALGQPCRLLVVRSESLAEARRYGSPVKCTMRSYRSGHEGTWPGRPRCGCCCCCSAGWWCSIRFQRESPPHMRRGSAEVHRDRSGHSVDGGRHDDRDAIVQPLRRSAQADRPDGPARGAYLRDTRPDGPPPEPCCLTCDHLAVGGIRCYQLAANTAIVVRVPNDRRAQAFGIASMGDRRRRPLWWRPAPPRRW